MLEAICGKCAETFVPADENDVVHGVTENGDPCGGVGVIAGEWFRPGWRPNAESEIDDDPRVYVIGIPLVITVTDEGFITFDFDISEAAGKGLEPVDDNLPDQTLVDDAAVIQAAISSREGHIGHAARVITITRED